MIIRLCTLLVILFSVSCSTSVVHIYGDGLENEEADRIRRIIESEGFRVNFNILEIPQDISTPTIIYSPFRQDLSDISRLEETLANAGYQVKLAQGSSGNHFYTRNNIGFFPITFADWQVVTGNSNSTPGSGDSGYSLLGKEFTASCLDEDLDGYLVLEANNRFTLDFIAWNEDNTEYQDGSRTGKWSINGQLLELSDQREAAPFVMESSVEEYQDGRAREELNAYQYIQLFNVLKNSGVFRGCDFSHLGSLN